MDAGHLNIRHLGAVIAVARSGSLSAAALDVHITQPALTQAIAKLEAQLDVRLFERRPNGVELTAATRLILPRLESALRLIGSNHITAAQIRAFTALARTGSYTGAAKQIGLAQPSVHRVIASLSALVGYALVERRGRSLLISRRGRALARRMTLAMSELRGALADLSDLLGRDTGRVVIGAMPLSRAKLLPDAIAAFHDRHPDADIVIVEGSYGELIGPIRDGEIDMMIGALRDVAMAEDFSQEALFADVPMIIGRAGHPLTLRRGPPDIADLAAFDWIVPGVKTPLRMSWNRMFEQAGASCPRVPIECGSALTIRQLLVGGDFLTLLSPDQFALELQSNMLAIICPAPIDVARTIGVTTRTEWRPARLQAVFLEALRRSAAAMAGNKP